MASMRKRPRTKPEDNQAEHPFTIKRINLQKSPFAPCGKFKTHKSMDLSYQIDSAKKWTEMIRYNSFVLNGTKYFSESFIYIANDSSIERQKAVDNDNSIQQRKKSAGD
ncbi:hypothetical protein NEMBOFW57_009442 [Staphylotrichum longicolle]|uniref:Uncharacterized protein n=1 Tax=Staphylotrichum longicolle TaxID=669026 RepID=A0AAD4ESU9_9PEZI|nr:hypothetical protein NEMBOFW57_009442 [Staphylotrichum longicolle]